LGAEDFTPNRGLEVVEGGDKVIAGVLGFPFTLGGSPGSIISAGRITPGAAGARSDSSKSMTSAVRGLNGSGNFVVLRFFNGLSSSSTSTISSTSAVDLEELERPDELLGEPLVVGAKTSSSDSSSIRALCNPGGGRERLYPCVV